ncbi:radiation sensitive protein rad9 [Lecanicillium sp. MT-2017a]|nr:radiation sensitive protein rad9 [Lecanicillium sp. MT-2017a]
MPIQVPVQKLGESQDSQAILEALRAELGVESVASSPAVNAAALEKKPSDTASIAATCQPTPGDPSNAATKQPLEELSSVPNARLEATDKGEDGAAATKPAPPTIEPTGMTDTVEPNYGGDDSLPDTLPETLPQDNTSYLRAELLQDTKRWNAASAPDKDVSQQTPTQPNEGRSYDEACTRVLSSMVNLETQQSNLEPRTLNEDDTGAVNFGSLTQYPRQSSPVSEDVGFENAHGGWRIPDDTQQNSLYSHTPYKNGDAAPETPALPKNPFGAAAAGPAPFAGTQLFGQTQLLTSAVKNSPTSSRPSPNIFHNPVSPNMMETSPLKNRANVSSPTDVRTSSPQRLHEVPATVMKAPQMAAIAEETPSIRRSMKEETIPESPTYQRPKSSDKQPMAHYEPMKQSQARKAVGEPEPMALDHDSDSDDAVQRFERRRRIERKRAQAAQEMVKITFPSLSHQEPDGPSAVKRRRIGNERGHSAPPVDDDRWGKAVTKNIQPLQDTSGKDHLPSGEPPSLESTKATPGEEAEGHEKAPQETADVTEVPVTSVPEDEMIPATSPVEPPSDNDDDAPSPASEPDLPVLPRDATRENASAEEADSSSLPPLTGRRLQTYGRRARSLRATAVISSSASASASVGQASDKAKHGAPHATAPELGVERPSSLNPGQPTPVTTRSRAKRRPHTPTRQFIENLKPKSRSLRLQTEVYGNDSE